MTRKKRNKNETKNETSSPVLSKLDVDILFCIATGIKTNKQLHAKLKKRKGKKVPKPTISHHTTKLQKTGLISAQKLFNLKEFYLTDHGKLAVSNFMTRGQGLSLVLPVRGHAFGFVCEIVRRPRGLDGRLKGGNWVAFYPKNRVAYKRRLMGCMVIFNPRSVQFMPPEVYAPSQDASFEQALRLVLKVKDFLEEEEFPGLVLGSPSQVARVTQQHYARPFDPLANEYYRDSVKTGVRTTYRSDRLAVDLSPGFPELETVHRVFSKDDLARITQFYEQMIRGELSWTDLEAIRTQLPKHIGQVMQRLDILDKGLLGQDKILSHLASSTVTLTGSIEENTRAVSNLVKLLKPQKRKRKKRVRARAVPRQKADQKVDEIRSQVEETLAKLQKYEAKE